MTKARSNAVANAAKGDLTVGNGTDLSGILAVGSNGDTLVADSSTSTGLRYQADFAAGKNKIINGDFGIWQRGTSFTITSAGQTYSADRHAGFYNPVGGTIVASQQTFTPGTAPVAGYEGQYYLRHVSTSMGGGSYYDIGRQYVEDVRTFAGQTVTFSFWARANSTATTNIYFSQFFGSGGSAGTDTLVGFPTITTSWTRYTVTGTFPSISGKTIGTGSAAYPFIRVGGNNTIEIWGVQLEAGSVATAFQTATGTIQGELAACQRYYYRLGTGSGQPLGLCQGETTNIPLAVAVLPVTMRTAPTLDQATGTNYYLVRTANANNNFNSFTLESSSITAAVFYSTGTIVSGAGGRFTTNNVSAYVGFSAEL